MIRALLAAGVILAGVGVARADRACAPADVARYEFMLGRAKRGAYITDPRFGVTVHYLGTAIVKGVCFVKLAPAY